MNQLTDPIHNNTSESADPLLQKALAFFNPIHEEGKEIWESMTDDQKKQLYLSYLESENEDNLIPGEVFLNEIRERNANTRR